MTDRPFWIDYEYDRDQASDSTGRYGAYVRQDDFDPWTEDDQRVELAAFAWRRATGPVMAPGYVRYHPRITGASLYRSDWDGALIAAVSLITAWPVAFGRLRGQWRDWPSQSWSEPGFRDPDSDEIACARYLLPSAELRFAVPAARLPVPPAARLSMPPAAPADLVAACYDAVAVLVDELNQMVGPILDLIEGAR